MTPTQTRTRKAALKAKRMAARHAPKHPTIPDPEQLGKDWWAFHSDPHRAGQKRMTVRIDVSGNILFTLTLRDDHGQLLDTMTFLVPKAHHHHLARAVEGD